MVKKIGPYLGSRPWVLGLATFLMVGPVAPARTLTAQDARPSSATPPQPSVQLQIDELREGQARILRELADLRRLLEEKTARRDSPIRPVSPNPAPGAAPIPIAKKISVDIEGEPFRGSPGARVAIMEYSDFDCSHCARFVREIYPLIDQDYIRPGKMKYFFRDLPGPGDANALLKAKAARCAGEQGRFWEMHDRLFATQTENPAPDPMSHALALGLDVDKFNACLVSDRHLENVRLSIAGAKKVGIYGTPAFLVGTVGDDGKLLTVTKVLVGGESLAPLKAALDELIATPAGR